jgi:hypothetical protein
LNNRANQIFDQIDELISTFLKRLKNLKNEWFILKNKEITTGAKKSSLSSSSPESFPGSTSNGSLESVFVKHIRIGGPAYQAGTNSYYLHHRNII